MGLTNSDAVLRQVDNVAYNNCEPPLTIVQETVRDAAGQPVVVVVNIPQGEQRPYHTNCGVYYLRATSGRRQASREELLRLFQATQSLYYDETLVYRATLADLDSSALERFLLEAYGRQSADWDVPRERLLENLRLARDGHPTLAGWLFFGRTPQTHLPYAHITAARIPGVDLAPPPADHKQLEGALPVLLDEAFRFVKLHLRAPHVIEDLQPEARPELPEVALREVLVNALAHRDYTLAAPVRVFVFDDRVEIRTPGPLPNSVTIAAMQLGVAHVLRNPTLYTLFSRLGLVTGVGSGLYRTIRLVREATGREPDLRVEGPEFVVALPRPP